MYLSDEVIYVCLLLLSIPIGFVFKDSRHANLKAWSSTVTGFIFALIVCRGDIVHSLVTTSVSCLILASVTARYMISLLWNSSRSSTVLCRYVHIATFVWCFSYLLFFRTTNLFSIELPVAHSNAIQLMLTLKVCDDNWSLNNDLPLVVLARRYCFWMAWFLHTLENYSRTD